MFEIFVDEIMKESIYGGNYYPSIIKIDDFEEGFQLPAGFWKVKDYKKSWLKSLRIGMGNNSHAVLAVSMGEKCDVNFIFTWTIYFKGDYAKIQNIMLFMENMKGFTPEGINSFANEYEEYDEDGAKISEWTTDYDSINKYIKKLELDLSM